MPSGGRSLAALLAVWALSCTLDPSGLRAERPGAPDAGSPDADAIDAEVEDADTSDASLPDGDADASDASLPDGDADASDASLPDGGGACRAHGVHGCSVSHFDIEDCERLSDGLEVAPACPTTSRVSLDCRSDTTASYCDTSPSCPGEGCVEETWFRFDLGASVSVDQVRFMAGWWADRPDLFEVWYTDSAAALPDAGATMAYAGSAATHPRRCVTGEPCTAEVPDGCCPDGRSNPQVTDQTSRTPSCDLGHYFPKFDIADFAPAVGRYWFFVVRTGAFDDRIYLFEVQLRGGTCT